MPQTPNKHGGVTLAASQDCDLAYIDKKLNFTNRTKRVVIESVDDLFLWVEVPEERT